jgi:uncharacterized repeat protein (TIGR01451 family)
MKLVAKVTQSGIARMLGSALVLAVLVSSTGLSLADWGPNRYEVVVRVFEGDPTNNVRVAGASLLMVADDRSNPDHGVAGTTDANGTYVFYVYRGSYNLEIRHPNYNGRDYYGGIFANYQLDASLIPLAQPNPTPTPTPSPVDGACLPTPPRGKPLFNVMPLGNGEGCTDYPMLTVDNVTRGGSGHSVNAQPGDMVRFYVYVHNGTVDYPENEAQNAMVRVGAHGGNLTGTANIYAEAWADNADLINSAQKGGDASVQMGNGNSLEFISGSAKIYGRNFSSPSGASDSIIAGGIGLGNIRGCYDFLKWVTFDARVIGETPAPTPTPTPQPIPTPTPTPGPTPTLAFSKTVRNVSDNQSGFVETTNADPGEQVEFQLTGTITGTIHNVVVTDALPAGLSYVDGSARLNGAPVAVVNGSVNVGTASDTTGNITFRATVAGEGSFAVGSTSVVNTATVTSSIGNRSDIATVVVTKAAPQVPTPTPTPTPTIAFTKSVRNVSANQPEFVDSTSANFGDQVEFQLKTTVTNTVTNIKISDVLPSGLSYVTNSLRLEGTDAGNDLGNINIGTLTAATRNVTFRATVAGEGSFQSGTTVLTNTANLSSSSGNLADTARVTVTKNVTPPPTPTPTPTPNPSPSRARLDIEKEVRNLSDGSNSSYRESVHARKDETVEFRIVIENTSNRTADNVRLSDDLPSQLEYIDDSLRIDGSRSNLDIFDHDANLGDLRRDDSITVTFRARVKTVTQNRTVTNEATARASNAGSVNDEAEVVLVAVQGGSVDINLSKRAWNNTQNRDATTTVARAGDLITYTLAVENRGSSDSLNFVFEDNIADILQLADLQSFSGANYNAGNQTLTWPSVTVPDGSRVEKQFTVRVKSPVPTGTDYVMTNIFGNDVKVRVQQPFVAPSTGAGTTVSLFLSTFSVAGYFLYRRWKQGKLTLALAK